MAPLQAGAHGYTRFERARIVGARALQIALGAPILLDEVDPTVDPVRGAIREFQEGVIPITVVREMRVRKVRRPQRMGRIMELEGAGAMDIEQLSQMTEGEEPS